MHVAARVGVWFVGGTALAIGMGLTAMAFDGFRPAHWPAWWLGGLAFIGIELVAHVVLLASLKTSRLICLSHKQTVAESTLLVERALACNGDFSPRAGVSEEALGG